MYKRQREYARKNPPTEEYCRQRDFYLHLPRVTGYLSFFRCVAIVLGVAPLYEKEYRQPLSAECREACRRLDRFTAEITLVCREHLDTPDVYKRQGLDTQLAQEWLSDREDGKLPDLIGINLESDTDARVDIIEVKTYADNPNAFTIDGDTISGHAVEQVTALESLTQEMLGKAEKITTISRREILREQVFECLFQATLDPASKLRYSNMLNDLFAGEYNVSVRRNIAFVDFENTGSSEKVYKGIDDFSGKDYTCLLYTSRCV